MCSCALLNKWLSSTAGGGWIDEDGCFAHILRREKGDTSDAKLVAARLGHPEDGVTHLRARAVPGA